MEKAENLLCQHRARLSEHLVARSGRETFRKECIILLVGLWGAKTLDRAPREEAGRAIELIVKYLVLKMPQKLPTMD